MAESPKISVRFPAELQALLSDHVRQGRRVSDVIRAAVELYLGVRSPEELAFPVHRRKNVTCAIISPMHRESRTRFCSPPGCILPTETANRATTTCVRVSARHLDACPWHGPYRAPGLYATGRSGGGRVRGGLSPEPHAPAPRRCLGHVSRGIVHETPRILSRALHL